MIQGTTAIAASLFGKSSFFAPDTVASNMPTSDQIRDELDRTENRRLYGRTFRTIIFILLIVAAVAVMIATFWMPVLRVCGASMEPTLDADQTVIATKGSDLKSGDIAAFYYNNKILLRRVIAVGGDRVVIDGGGTVSVNGNKVDESYVDVRSLGQCDIDFPYTVPDGMYFMLGDNRSASLDSRMNAIGCISSDVVIGKVVFKIWPLSTVGTV